MAEGLGVGGTPMPGVQDAGGPRVAAGHSAAVHEFPPRPSAPLVVLASLVCTSTRPRSLGSLVCGAGATLLPSRPERPLGKPGAA